MISSETDPLGVFVKDICVHTHLEADDVEALRRIPFRLRRLDAGAYLIREGSVPTECAVLVEGYAFRQKITGEGARQILAVCIPGDAVDLQNIFLSISDHSVQMLTNGIVADLQRDYMQNLVLARPHVGRALIKQTLVEASILREWVVNVGRRDARQRIAHILCEFAVRLETRGLAPAHEFELPMTQEQLADATGLTSVHVNRTLKAMEKDGLIDRRRRHIHFDDWRALQRAGDFTRNYLHLPGEDIVEHDFAA